ncbi:MAG TPA: lysophospholipid acyltransferase family protein [Candidatus Aquilonibacter sp.]|nr:lysophospholipid acyltransferase family protein [Candidatus Aquilonibacter sp.]
MLALLRMLLIYVVLGVPTALVGIPWSALRRNFDTMYGWGMGIMALGVKAAGIRIQLHGPENIEPGTQYIFLSNHVSNLDPLVLLPNIPGMTSALLKRELIKIPLLGTALLMGKFVPVERGSSRETAEKNIALAKDALNSGLHITVFPEGTRSPDGKLLPFKKGAFFLAEGTGAPIIPVIISGTRVMMPKGTLRIRPGVAHVTFLAPIRPQEAASRDELMQRVRCAMEEELERQRAGGYLTISQAI